MTERPRAARMVARSPTAALAEASGDLEVPGGRCPRDGKVSADRMRPPVVRSSLARGGAAGEQAGREAYARRRRRGAAPVCAALALAFAAQPAAASVKSFRAVLDRTEAHLGDVVKCLIEVQHDEGEVYELPDPLELGPFHVREVQVARKPDHTTFRLELQIFDVGEPEVPAVTLKGPEKVEIPPQKIKVLSLLDEEAQAAGPAPGAQAPPPDFKDVKPPVPYRVRSWWLLWTLGALVAAAALAVLGVWLWKRRRKRAERVAPPRPPHEVALEQLRALGQEALWAHGQKKEHYLKLSEIVRAYLEGRFLVLALEETTEELLDRLRRVSTPGLDYDRFAGWCREGDLVKFARHEPSDGQCKAAIEDAVRFVEATRLPPPEAAPADAQPRRAAA